MYNILIVSHGSIAKGFYETAEMIMGDVEGVRAIGIQPGESAQDFGEKVVKLADELIRYYTLGIIPCYPSNGSINIWARNC